MRVIIILLAIAALSLNLAYMPRPEPAFIPDADYWLAKNHKQEAAA